MEEVAEGAEGGGIAQVHAGSQVPRQERVQPVCCFSGTAHAAPDSQPDSRGRVA